MFFEYTWNLYHTCKYDFSSHRTAFNMPYQSLRGVNLHAMLRHSRHGNQFSKFPTNIVL